MRATVAGYREVTLAAELSSARAALDAAGIAADLPGAVDEVPGERRELFGWVRARGRHQRGAALRTRSGCGSRCPPPTVEMVDDGTGGPDGAPTGTASPGCASGWPRSAAGSRRGRSSGGGFRLYAEVPA